MRVIVGGALANRPGNGGGAWVRLSFVRGLLRLGFDVLFVEQLAASACRDAGGAPALPEDSRNLAYFRAVTHQFGLAGVSAVIVDEGPVAYGRPLPELIQFAQSAELLLNISGHLSHEALVKGPRVRAYVDLDPGFTQVWHEQGVKRVGDHDAYFTVGENIGRSGCSIPTNGLRWRPLRQPVVLDDWPVAADADADRLTTVASWRGPYGPLQLDGRRLGVKVHEFRRFWSLPGQAPQCFEVALDIGAGDRADREELLRRGWRLVDPAVVACDPGRFRDYVTGSGGEFSPAQGVYVETGSGWFSDRTVRYLAAGRPALVQDTGLEWARRGGEGLVSFRTLGEAIAGARRVQRDYTAHRQAARAIAEERFDSDKILSALVDELRLPT